MKSTLVKVAAFILLGLAFGSYVAKANLMDYSSDTNASINFDGHSHFSFSPTVNNLTITLDGAATGLPGEVTGVFTIGTITTFPIGATAPVSGSGTFVVHDGLSYDLKGDLVWIDITQVGTGDSLNISGLLNMTNITYGGTNPTLQTLAAAHSATNVLSFQFTPAVSLTSLKNAPHTTSFSGSISVPDGGTTLLMLGLALSAVALLRRRLAIA